MTMMLKHLLNIVCVECKIGKCYCLNLVSCFIDLLNLCILKLNIIYYINIWCVHMYYSFSSPCDKLKICCHLLNEEDMENDIIKVISNY